jgi:hypothetical protein
VRFALAQALWPDVIERPRPRALAEAAVSSHLGAEGDHAQDAAAMRGWLARAARTNAAAIASTPLSD